MFFTGTGSNSAIYRSAGIHSQPHTFAYSGVSHNVRACGNTNPHSNPGTRCDTHTFIHHNGCNTASAYHNSHTDCKTYISDNSHSHPNTHSSRNADCYQTDDGTVC